MRQRTHRIYVIVVSARNRVSFWGTMQSMLDVSTSSEPGGTIRLD